MDPLSERLRPRAAAHLVQDIEGRDYHLSTGFIGTGYLCPVLSETGYTDVAYQLALSDTFPSWGYGIRRGATTIWERWNGVAQEGVLVADVYRAWEELAEAGYNTNALLANRLNHPSAEAHTITAGLLLRLVTESS
jgi:hypothetical protein